MPPVELLCWDVAVIDPVSGASLQTIDFAFAMQDVRDAMERAPDVEREGFVAWGRVTRAELEPMLQLLGDDSDVAMLDEIPFERGFCSLYWSGGRWPAT